MLTFRILSALLSYPEPELCAEAPALADVLVRDALLPLKHQRAIAAFASELAALPPLEAEERYVALFDRHRSLSLHLYEHVHGESRERGQAMASLAEMYRLHGLEPRSGELPDYLPLFLEFLSLLPPHAATSLLGEAVHVVAAMRQRLAERGSSYAAILAAVEALALEPADCAAVDAVLGTLPPEGDSLAALDRQWEEEAVRFTAAGAPDGMSGGAAMSPCGS